jgi:hypothetical protein
MHKGFWAVADYVQPGGEQPSASPEGRTRKDQDFLTGGQWNNNHSHCNASDVVIVTPPARVSLTAWGDVWRKS